MRIRIVFVLLGAILIAAMIACMPHVPLDKEDRMAVLRRTRLPTLGALISVTFRPTPTPTATPTPLPSATSTPTLLPYALTVKSPSIAFLAKEELWIANSDGSGERRLLKWPTTDFAWCPDGKTLAAIHDGGLWLVFPFSEESPVRLAPQITLYGIKPPRSISWSPDGRWIIARNNQGLWAVASGGQTVRLLQEYRYDKPASHTWSSDAPRLIIREGVAPDRAGADFTWRLINVKTGENTAFSKLPPPLAHSSLWFIETIRRTVPRAFSVNAATRSVVALSPRNLSAICHGPLAWTIESPQGAWLAMASVGNGRYARLSVCVRNSTDAFLLYVDGHSSMPVWDLTGRYVYLVAANINPDQPNLDPQTRLMRFDIETRRLEQMCSLDRTWPEVGALQLSPDGRYLSRFTPHLIEIIDTRDWTTGVQSLDQYALEASRGGYSWTSDSRYLVFRINVDNQNDDRGSRLYAFGILTHRLFLVSNIRSISTWVVNPMPPVE